MLRDDVILPDPYNEQVAVSNEFFYQEMLRQKELAIEKEEVDFNRRCLVELKKKFVEDKLIEKEHELFAKMKSE